MSAAAVLFVDHATALGGAQHSLLLSLEQLDRAAFRPHLAAPPGALTLAADRLDVCVHTVPLARLRRTPWAPVRLARSTVALMEVIHRERIHLVHHNTMRASFSATLAARLTGRPTVWQVHDIFRPGAYTRAMCRWSRGVVAVSAAAAAPLPCREQVRVIPNGVRLADFEVDQHAAAAQLRAQWGVPAWAPVIGHIARLQPWKGQRDVIAAAAMVLRTIPDAYFVFVGGDIFGDATAYERGLKATVADRGLSQRVIFAGHQSDITKVLPALNVVVHASIEEPFGRVLIEAGAAGLPVVAYATGGVPEILVHEQTGLLVHDTHPGALAAALERVLQAPALARALGDGAREHVRRQFDIRRLTRDVEAAYRRALAV